MLLLLVLRLLLLANGEGADKAALSKVWPVPPAVPLPTAEVKTTSTQWFWRIGTPQCDGEGNIYWHQGSLKVQELTFVKLFTDGSSVTYHPAGSRSTDLEFISYYVTYDGELFALATDKANYKALYLLKAGNDPSSFSSTRLNVPDGLDPMTVNGFAVLPGGETFLHGYFDKADRGRSYFLELDASGKVLRNSSGQVSDSAPEAVDKGIVPTPLAPAVGGDGLIYVLGTGRILGLSPDGKITRTIPLSPPKDGYDSPFDLRAAGNRLLLTWRKSGERRLDTEYELLDGSTGEVLRLYRAAQKDMLVCFTRDSLIFDGGKDKAGYIRLLTAPIN